MLCGLLVSVMIVTSLVVLDMTAYVAPVDEVVTVETETPTDKDADGADNGVGAGTGEGCDGNPSQHQYGRGQTKR